MDKKIVRLTPLTSVVLPALVEDRATRVEEDVSSLGSTLRGITSLLGTPVPASEGERTTPGSGVLLEAPWQ